MAATAEFLLPHWCMLAGHVPICGNMPALAVAVVIPLPLRDCPRVQPKQEHHHT